MNGSKLEKGLLEKAARALTLHVKGYGVDDTDNLTHLVVGAKFTRQRVNWNPLTNPAQCAEMEAQLQIDVNWHEERVFAIVQGVYFTELYAYHASKNHARMYACTKAAASLGD